MDTQGPEKRVVRVTIFQQPYTLRASGDPAETEAVARGVDELMNQIADRTSSNDAARVAVMAAMHLADKIRALESRAEALEASLTDTRDSLEASSKRAETAERALEELGRVSREEETKAAGVVVERVAGLHDRLTTLDERLAALLENGRA